MKGVRIGAMYRIGVFSSIDGFVPARPDRWSSAL